MTLITFLFFGFYIWKEIIYMATGEHNSWHKYLNFKIITDLLSKVYICNVLSSVSHSLTSTFLLNLMKLFPIILFQGCQLLRNIYLICQTCVPMVSYKKFWDKEKSWECFDLKSFAALKEKICHIILEKEKDNWIFPYHSPANYGIRCWILNHAVSPKL